MTSKSRTKTTNERISGNHVKTERWGKDPLMCGSREYLYDKYARNLNHPKYIPEFTRHYDELARIDRKLHDLNYPCLPSDQNNQYSHKGTMQGTLSIKDSFYQSSDLRYKSKYSGHLHPEVKTVTLRDQIIEKCKQQGFDDYEQLVSIIMKSLLDHGLDEEEIQLAFQNLTVNFEVHEDTSEIEISFHF